jgi:hypothetical protein
MTVPCADPANDPEDWFLEKNGKQYDDDVLVTEELLDAYLVDLRAAYDATGLEGWPLPERDVARVDLEAHKLKEALRRRRHAKDKCHVECYFRLQCLSRALDGEGGIEYGTQGGYYPEELKKIATLRAERQARREAQLPDGE